MDIWNLGASLGIGGLLAIGFYKIAMVLIRVWSNGDTARTAAITAGFKAITDSHAALIAAERDNNSALIDVVRDNNEAMLQAMNDQRRYIDATFANIDKSINALEVRVSTALDLTPVRGVQKAELEQMQPASSRMVTTTMVAGVIETRQDETPRGRPGPTERARSQGGGVVTGGYFERSSPVKKKP